MDIQGGISPAVVNEAFGNANDMALIEKTVNKLNTPAVGKSESDNPQARQDAMASALGRGGKLDLVV